MATPKPLALSLGDPGGIGPEIVAKAWRNLASQGPTFVLIGDVDVFVSQDVPVLQVGSLEEGVEVFAQGLPVLHRPCPVLPTPGQSTPQNAHAVIDWIKEAVACALTGEASGVVTAPIAKAPLYEAGFRFPGHTEFIHDLTANVAYDGERGPVMMLTARDLRVVLVTIHVPINGVSELVTVERVVSTARVTHQTLRRDFGIERPRLALAGLNPHAGESGAIGLEERTVLAPAVAVLRADGIDITEPQPADTLFHEEARKNYDATVCLYHDQGLIPVKTLDFWGGVNATLGLPIVRTSPDHGVGFDIAGKGAARADSLIAAIHLAAAMAARRAA